MSEAYNRQRKLWTISEIKKTDNILAAKGEHLNKGKRKRDGWIPASMRFQFFRGTDDRGRSQINSKRQGGRNLRRPTR